MNEAPTGGSSDDGVPPRPDDARPEPPVDDTRAHPTELVAAQSGGFVLPESGQDPDGPLLGMATAEQVDAFRELRTRLLAMGTACNLPRFTVMVVPIEGGAGASFVARNLAAAFTLQEQRRAVLIDCNLRNPTQHLAFDLQTDGDGLFDYLERPEPRADRLLRRTAQNGLFLIPAGHASSPAREYFSSSVMRSLLTWLRKAPCYLILDGPPVKGSPDARILSELVDFVVLVAGYGHDSAAGVAEAAALFSPTKLAGVVFNEQT